MSVDPFVSASLDISDVEKGLDGLDHVRLAPGFKELKTPMRADQKDHGKRQRGPIGSWPRRSSKTLEFYRSHHRRVPKPMGRLPTAVEYKATASGLSGVSRAKWSDVMNEGGVVGRGVKLRARPFLWISSRFLDLAEATFDRMLLAAYGGSK